MGFIPKTATLCVCDLINQSFLRGVTVGIECSFYPRLHLAFDLLVAWDSFSAKNSLSLYLSLEVLVSFSAFVNFLLF